MGIDIIFLRVIDMTIGVFIDMFIDMFIDRFIDKLIATPISFAMQQHKARRVP